MALAVILRRLGQWGGWTSQPRPDNLSASSASSADPSRRGPGGRRMLLVRVEAVDPSAYFRRSRSNIRAASAAVLPSSEARSKQAFAAFGSFFAR